MLVDGTGMSTRTSSTVRTRLAQGALQASSTPNPFPTASGFRVVIHGGQSPYSVTPVDSPPNPPGVTVHQVGSDEWEVHVPAGTPAGMGVAVVVTDSTQPSPQSVRTGSITA